MRQFIRLIVLKKEAIFSRKLQTALLAPEDLLLLTKRGGQNGHS